MCGITGWVSFGRELSGQRREIEAMTATMSCRGPDAAGIWVEGHAALGHRRLAVIDLPGGAQPMSVSTPDGPVVIVYSGEAYNFPELRAELAGRGHRFATRSDTEVVLHGYLEWGPAVAERLNGMYAFAVWDARTERLVLVRDRMGIKPFYLYETPDGVLFGSEPKAILAHPAAEHAVTLDGVRELFAGVKTPGHAIWDGMREVEPGTVVTVDRRGLRTTRYWSLRTAEHTDDRGATVERVRELLEDIVARQLVADVPRCTLLSGGLDSSAMTAVAARQLAATGETVRSFAVDFVGQTENFVPDELRSTPDTPYVHDVVAASRTDHRDIVLDADQLADPDVRARVITARDLPLGLGDMDASLLLLFQAIRGHSTVALSGESADEVFGGYKQFFDAAARSTPDFPWRVAGSFHDRDAEAILHPELAERLRLNEYVRESYDGAVAAVDRLDGETALESRMREICYLHLTRFVRQLLDRKDRMSMAVGLEVRVPFCDHRLVEYVYRTPWAMKTFDGREKSLLRRATADVLPDSVVRRVKSPYPSTQDPRYLVNLKNTGRDYLADPSHPVFDLVNPGWLAGVLDRDATGSVERHGIERVLNLAVWLDIYRPALKLSSG